MNLKFTLLLAMCLIPIVSHSSEVALGTDGVSIELPTVINNLSIKISGGYMPLKFRVSNNTSSNLKAVQARIGVVYGDGFLVGVFFDRSKISGWSRDKSVGGFIKESVSVREVSFYSGYKAMLSKKIVLNVGAQIMPFVSYRAIDSTVPINKAKEINDMKTQLSKYRIGSVFVIPSLSVGYRF